MEDLRVYKAIYVCKCGEVLETIFHSPRQLTLGRKTTRYRRLESLLK